MSRNDPQQARCTSEGAWRALNKNQFCAVFKPYRKLNNSAFSQKRCKIVYILSEKDFFSINELETRPK